MTAKTALLRSQLLLYKPFSGKFSLKFERAAQEKIGKLMAFPHKNNVIIENVSLSNCECAMITPKDILSNGIILYLHGGGFVSGNLDYAKGFATTLAAKCGIRVFCVAYRLAPEHVFPAAIDDSLSAYYYLLSHGYSPKHILLCGESAGGGLCYSLCQTLRNKNHSLPAGIIAVSPWVDLSCSGTTYETNKHEDPSMTIERLNEFANCYIGKHSPKKDTTENINPVAETNNPLVSPLFDSLDKMPPSLIFVGEDEIMLSDSTSLHQKLVNKKIQSELVIAPNLWHAYLLYDLNDREQDFDKINSFINKTINSKKKLKWMALDNAAKIFPAARSRNWSNLFRVSATLNEDIDREIMQSALDVTARRFPSIAVRLRTGVFWYSLEELPHAPTIEDEHSCPLVKMPFGDVRKCAFRVIVYKKRVAVEFFHALTDGNGGLIFVKTLVSEYLSQKYGENIPCENGILDRLEEPTVEELEDSFLKHAGKHKLSRKDSNAYCISGIPEEDGYKTNTTFILDANQLIAESKKRNVTVTAYMSAILITAAQRVQAQRVKRVYKQRPIKVHIPANLRKLFPSKTMRNFILCACVGIDPKMGDYSFDEICQIVNHQMKLQITPKHMAAMIKTNVDSERNILLRIVPLFIKNIVMKLVFNSVGERKGCFSFSNLGVVNVPDEFAKHVNRMDFVLSSQAAAPYNTSALTYSGKTYLNIIRNITNPVLETQINNVLKELNLSATVESNTRR